MDKIIVIGAGLCGSLMALRLAQRGYEVAVYEKRPDMRSSEISAGRSINLALSDRGLKGLEMVGLKEKALELVIPMFGRMIHPMTGEQSYVPYSGRKGECINSISRGGLNMLLLDEAEKTGKINITFLAECTDFNFETGQVKIRKIDNDETWYDKGIAVLGTDGASSAVRQAMMKNSNAIRFQYSQHFLDTGYKELSIPAKLDGGFRIEKNALHIWPREGFMVIALPNLDGSFTVTLFLPFEGKDSFTALKTDTEIVAFFEKYFPSALEHMPEILMDYKANPASSLGTIKCFPWQINGKVALMGDAAHAVVPFYGQGMNASFEDCLVLDGFISDYKDDWTKILQAYQQSRKVNADAIADLAVDNFYEMKAATADPIFGLKRKIELLLEQKYDHYFSKYSMVTFREDLPYHTAMTQGRKQDEVLMAYAAEVGDLEKVDEQEILKRLSEIDLSDE